MARDPYSQREDERAREDEDYARRLEAERTERRLEKAMGGRCKEVRLPADDLPVPGGAAMSAVWTSGDICKEYGINRSNFAYWRRQSGFPEPQTYSKNKGGTWDAAEVRAWVQAFRAGAPETRAKRVQVVRQFTRGATVSAVARNAGIDRKTARRWLRAAGVLPTT